MRTVAWIAAGLGLVLVIVGGIAWGWVEMAGLVLGMALVCMPAWYSSRTSRVVGAVLLAGLLGLMLRPALRGAVGDQALAEAGTWLLAAVLGLAAWRFLGTQVLRRVCFLVPSLLLLIYVTTALMYAAPGSPFQAEKAVSEQSLARQKARFGVSDSALGFFSNYMVRLVSEGSLGESVKSQGRSVNDLLLPALPVSMTLGLLALVISVALGLILGIRAGLKPHSLADVSSMGLAMIGISLPNFVIGAGLLVVFSMGLGWFPVAGWGSHKHLVLPAITLALPSAAYIARLARNGTMEIMQQDYIRTARAKGLTESVVVLKHALKGAIKPVVSFLGPATAGIFTGSFVVETLFGIPGMGQYFVKGATDRDYAVVLGTAIIYFTIITFFNLLVDIAYSWLDPRVRETV